MTTQGGGERLFLALVTAACLGTAAPALRPGTVSPGRNENASHSGAKTESPP